MLAQIESVATAPAWRDAPARVAVAAPVGPAQGPAKRSRPKAEDNPGEAMRASVAVLSRPARARLSYDQIESRTFVEVLNPRTGEVLFRFPPEAMADHLEVVADAEPGELLDQTA